MRVEYNIGDVLVITEDILHEDKLYFKKGSQVIVVNPFTNSTSFIHVRANNNEVNVLFRNDAFVTLKEYIKNRDVKIDKLLDG